MDKNTIGKIIQAVFRQSGGVEDGVKKFQVKGAVEGESTEIVDFISDRLVFSDLLDYDGAGKTLDSEQCQLLLRQAVDKNRAYLKSVA